MASIDKIQSCMKCLFIILISSFGIGYGLNKHLSFSANLTKYFCGIPGTFEMFDLKRNRYTRYNPKRNDEHYLPASTFKIMNSLIALESGIVPDENYVIKWDGTKYDIPSWNADQNLKSGMSNSVVWFYQELARRTGWEKMKYYVENARYGNTDISGKIDSFWLEGGLRISADEQVEFLRSLYLNELPFKDRVVNIVKEIIILERNNKYTLRGKTGSVTRVLPHIGWFVGYLERDNDVYFFALNIDSPGNDAAGFKAKEITRSILKSYGLM